MNDWIKLKLYNFTRRIDECIKLGLNTSNYKIVMKQKNKTKQNKKGEKKKKKKRNTTKMDFVLCAMNLDIDPSSAKRERSDKQQPWRWRI